MASHDPTALRQAAEAYLADEIADVDRAELEALLAAEDWDELADRLSAPLVFGTAGLRGLIGAGPNRMNAVSVARATAGLARQLLADDPDVTTRGVVVGRDGRRRGEELATICAEILAGHGIPVHWIPQPTSTPVGAFAVRHLNASAGAIVTASHNPPPYNGFKVYAARGAQIVPPQDTRVAEERETCGPTRDLPRLAFADAVAQGLVTTYDDTDAEGPLVDAYLDALDGQCLLDTPPPAQPRAVTTALHGVGHRFVHRALARRGFTDLHAVASQAEPDGEFPTVAFPNPEEDGALDLALALAAEVDADLIVANDPDTDRLCVAAKDPSRDGGFRVLTGNELGVLLADWLLGERARRGTTPAKPAVYTTIVSTSMLARVAAAYGADSGETVTGFKWIWDRGIDHEADGGTFVFGFEEALGYCVGPVVRDKDGIGAAQALMELAASLKAQDRTLLDQVADLARAHGLHATSQVSVTLPGLDGKARIAQLMADFRATPPSAVAGADVVRVRDLAGPDADAAGLPRSNVLTWWLADGSRIIVRPSGTEPKLKSYFEVRVPVQGDGPAAVPAAEAAGAERLSALAGWMRAALA